MADSPTYGCTCHLGFGCHLHTSLAPDPPLTVVDPRLIHAPNVAIAESPIPLDARLEQIRQREQAATKGPWGYDLNGTVAIIEEDYEWGSSICQATWRPLRLTDDANLQFLAHAREDIPYLLAELTRLRAERDEQAKHAQDAWRQLNGECPICVEKGILPSRPYGCYGHSQVVIENLETAEAERDEAQHRLDLFKNQLSVQEERTDSWHEAYDALHAQLEELKDCVCDWINEGLIVPDGRLSSMLASAPSAVPEPTG